MLNLDSTDIRILEILQRDAKINIKEIAGDLGLTKTPIYERIKRLERNGAIDKYVAIVNRQELPSSMIVFLQCDAGWSKIGRDRAIQKGCYRYS